MYIISINHSILNNYVIYNLKIILFILTVCTTWSCSSQKNTATSRGMQNLTARYNYIYNSKNILDNHRLTLAETYPDNFDQVLPVYLGPEVDQIGVNSGLNLQPMEDIIKKAQLIIFEKNFSNYIDDAYILLGKANFYNGAYFNAAEYFDYIIKNYKSDQNIYLEGLSWKARSFMQLKRLNEANIILDTLDSVLLKIKVKKMLAEPYATIGQMCIYLDNDTAAISYLEKAVNLSKRKQDKIRWTYILAQLHEKLENYEQALLNYRKVEKSNAPFEMYFNAKLNQIKLKALQNDIGPLRQDQLLSLLKDDKNFDYNDQIYFHIAELNADGGQYQEALKYYLLSINQSTNNKRQKGLSYLKLADLNFKYFKNYLLAKEYYDSTITTLPKNYPGYDLILKKSLNLKYLTDRYEIIALQDSLQTIAKLPEALRSSRIQKLVNNTLNPPIQKNELAKKPNSQSTFNASNTQLQNSFYFSNPTAISIGFSDFKRKWGERKLENNWRQAMRTSALETSQDIATATSSLPVNLNDTAGLNLSNELVAEYTRELPLTEQLMASSDQKIIDAYYEIASFYLQELNDASEATEIYQILLKRYPQNNHLASIYYSLYLMSQNTDPTQSYKYKNLILKDFPNSVFAKTILDPSYSLKQSALEEGINDKYNEIFDQYEKKNFNTVVKQVDETMASNQSNTLSPQLAYLKAIGIGRTSNVDSLLLEFDNITERFPEDKLVTPIVRSHITYIKANLEKYKSRKIALLDVDPKEIPFQDPATTANNLPALTPSQPLKIQDQPQAISLIVQKKPDPTALPDSAKANSGIKTDGTFSTAAGPLYYFVIHVSDASLTLNSSRFGIGQFNRGNYSGNNLRHQLKEFDNDQLIYVGNFSNFEDAKSYANAITPQLKQIMKVPVNIYSNFIISKENFDKLISKDLLDKYMEFYKNNY